ncbi:MAG: adenosylcobalamin-dependent ribonucleoside-diphosphate reductase [Gammaproteobacteria bacterium]|nr:adenosylcobalamin-dependent ribonucleoside-diphosphate reductase [Gammaproteobacteria bacterium]
MSTPEQLPQATSLPIQQICFDVLQEKYAKEAEKNLDGIAMMHAIRQRVATALAQVENTPADYVDIFMRTMEAGFIAGGRVNSAAGTKLKHATLINCFVQPVGDSISSQHKGKAGIYSALKDAAETMRRGGGVGYDFSSIRPQGALVKGTSSSASGPVSYMQVFNQSCATVESAGARRGAQMGVLRIDHPDILEFVSAKLQATSLNNFNISVAVTNDFMQAMQQGETFELVHEAEPAEALQAAGAYQREDGQWVYRQVDPQAIWAAIMDNTYQAAEPGVLFIDQINQENNLHYCETIEATNPCGEIPIPDYGCCCLGSVNLTAFVQQPFSPEVAFDFAGFAQVVTHAVRMLDNVLTASAWPLAKQQKEAQNKRRIGLGYTGLGDTLIEMGLAYNSEAAREFAARLTEYMRDTAYRASIELAKEKGAFPLFEAEAYLDSAFCQRLPEDIRADIRTYGIRNSHLLSIAPTGTISLAFADNASNGIEPAFAWYYTRTKRMADGTSLDYPVEDHAYRVWQSLHGDGSKEQPLPPAFVSALEISARDHMLMQAAIQPFIDAAISKTVNVPEDYPFTQFADLYADAWRAGLKGITTYRPNAILGSVLTVESAPKAENNDNLDQSEPNRKLQISATPEVALASLRWPERPEFATGNPGVTYMVGSKNDPASSRFALFIGHTENGKNHPFEVWVNGAEQPRGLTAVAKNLSMDMRSEDHEWLKLKLNSLSKTAGVPFDLAMPPTGQQVRVPGNVAAMAKLIDYRCQQLGAFDENQTHAPLVAAMFSRKEPKSGTTGTLSWTVDVHNPTTGDDFAMFVKECLLPDGSHRPYSVWLSGSYPLDFNGLTKSLSLDMRVLDPAWIGKKLRGLRDLREAQGDFFAKVPGEERQAVQPSTVAYIARLLIHRYAMLGILDADGMPLNPMGMMTSSKSQASAQPSQSANKLTLMGKACQECGASAVIRRDGCDFCTACGQIGSCG